MDVSGSYAYLANGYAGLKVIDISAPLSPQEVGAFNTPGIAVHVDVEGSYAYVADDVGGLRVMDVSDHASPREVGSFSPSPVQKSP